MALLIGIGIIIVGAVGTVTAFGGKTWIDGSEPLVKRITTRGYASLSCLAVSLCLGCLKECQSEKNIALSKTDAERERAELNRKLSDSYDQLNAANTKLAVANTQLGDLRFSFDRARSDSKISLDQVQVNLNEANKQLGYASATDLVTALTNGNRMVARISVLLPISHDGSMSKIPAKILIPKMATACETVSLVEAYIPDEIDFPGGLAEFKASDKNAVFSDKGNLEEVFARSAHLQPAHAIALSEALEGYGVHQQSYNGNALLYEARIKDKNVSAAKMLNDLRRGAVVFELSAQAFTNFESVSAAEHFVHDHPGFGELQSSTGGMFSHFPSKCIATYRDYWAKSFAAGIVIVTLDGDPALAFILGIQAKKPRVDGYEIKQDFVIGSTPQISVRKLDDLREELAFMSGEDP